MPRVKAFIESKKKAKVAPEPEEGGSNASLSFTGMNAGLLTVDEERRASTAMEQVVHTTARRVSKSLFPGNKTAVDKFADCDASENTLAVNFIEELVQETGAAVGVGIVEDVKQVETIIAQENKSNAGDAVPPTHVPPGPPALTSSDDQEVDVFVASRNAGLQQHKDSVFQDKAGPGSALSNTVETYQCTGLLAALEVQRTHRDLMTLLDAKPSVGPPFRQSQGGNAAKLVRKSTARKSEELF
jgi:hypothetical protein